MTSIGWQLEEVTDSIGRVIEYTYNEQGRLILVFESTSGLSASFEYNSDGELIHATDSKGRTESYEYDFDASRVRGFDWIPEGQLRDTCEQVCEPKSNSCDSGGACDAAVASAFTECLGSCDLCAQECGADVCGIGSQDGACQVACADGVDGVPGCDAGCAAQCEDTREAGGFEAQCGEVDINSLCRAMENSVCRPSLNTERGMARYQFCDKVARCAGASVGSDDQVILDICPSNWDGLVASVLGILNAHVDVVECALNVFTFGLTDLDCGFTRFKLDWLKSCQERAEWCCRDGIGCAEGSCNEDHDFQRDCRDAFMGNKPSSSNSCSSINTLPDGGSRLAGDPDLFCDNQGSCVACDAFQNCVPLDSAPRESTLGEYAEAEGCLPRLDNDCQSECSDSCNKQCVPACEEDCQSSCDDACSVDNCPGYCSDLDFRGSCEEGCVSGCMDGSRMRSEGVKYGYDTDLNHNIVRVYDGNGNLFLENTYGTDPSKPDFDSIIRQDFGDNTVELFYRDVLAEEEGVVSPPVDELTEDLVQSNSEYEPAEIDCTDGSTLVEANDAPGQSQYGVWHNLLLGFGEGSSALSVIRPKAYRALTAPVAVYLRTSPKGAFAEVRVESTHRNLRLSAFQLKLSEGTLRFKPGRNQRFAVSGPTAAIEQLVALQSLTMFSDDSGGLQVFSGHPTSIANLIQGHCSQSFAVENLGDRVGNFPSTACSDSLVIAPLASSNTEQVTQWRQQDASSLERLSADAFVATALLPERGVFSLNRDGKQSAEFIRKEGSVSKLATTTQSSIISALKSVPLFSTPSKEVSENIAGQLFVFHDWTTVAGAPVSSGFGPLLFPLDSAPSFDAGPQVAELSTSERPYSATVLLDYHGEYWSYYYSKAGRLLRSVNHGTGATENYSYSSSGELLGFVDAQGGKACMHYDVKGRLLRSVLYPAPGFDGEVDPVEQRFEYDGELFRIGKVFDPRSGGSQGHPNAVLASYQWTVDGNPISSTDALGQVTNYSVVGGSGPLKGLVNELTD